jgi:hypothetical protein
MAQILPPAPKTPFEDTLLSFIPSQFDLSPIKLINDCLFLSTVYWPLTPESSIPLFSDVAETIFSFPFAKLRLNSSYSFNGSGPFMAQNTDLSLNSDEY